MNNFRLSPSDFAFLWEGCKRCFYLKVVEGFPRPHSIMPKIFTVIDLQMRECFSGARTEEIAAGMPSGVIAYGEKWVQSEPITVPGNSSTCFIRGKFDTVVKLDDGTHAVVDFKTSARKAEHLPLYARQLHAYAYALENPDPGKFALSPITKLGLLVFEPDSFCNKSVNAASLEGSMKWIEIPRDDGSFLEFLAEVMSVLEQPSPPGGAPSCEWCQYRDTSRRTGL